MHVKKSLVSLIAMIPLVLTSCNSSSAIKGLYNYDLAFVDLEDENINPFVEVGPEEIIEMVETGVAFPLFIHDVSCIHCVTANENFREVFASYPATIYRYTYANSTYDRLNEYDPYLFPETFSTPRVLIIEDGKINVEVAAQRVASTPSRLKGSLKSFVKLDNLYRVSLKESYEAFNSEYSNYILFTYSYSSLDTYNYVYKSLNKKKTTALFINTDESEEILTAELQEKGLDLTNPNLVSISGGEIENSVNISDNSAIDDFLTSFK